MAIYRTVNTNVRSISKHEAKMQAKCRNAIKAARQAELAAEEAAKPKMDFIIGGTRAENIAAYKRRLHELAKIQNKRYLTKSEAAEMNKLVHYLQVEPFLADIFREMREESEKYPQYIKDVPEWAQN